VEEIVRGLGPEFTGQLVKELGPVFVAEVRFGRLVGADPLCVVCREWVGVWHSFFIYA